jgi:hypothetical protein
LPSFALGKLVSGIINMFLVIMLKKVNKITEVILINHKV